MKQFNQLHLVQPPLSMTVGDASREKLFMFHLNYIIAYSGLHSKTIQSFRLGKSHTSATLNRTVSRYINIISYLQSVPTSLNNKVIRSIQKKGVCKRENEKKVFAELSLNISFSFLWRQPLSHKAVFCCFLHWLWKFADIFLI